ncbi:MAG TPA: glycosyltransferase family 39 protein [Solirubrobacteraceae bacterium]
MSRDARVGLVGIVLLAGGAIGVRVWLMLAYGPGFLSFPDSGEYAVAADLNIFRDPQRPAGYPFLLRLIHHLSDHVSFTIGVQHAMGVVAGVVLYKAVRRTGAPPWLGLIPATIVFFGATGLVLEHSLLADAPFAFFQVLSIYCAIRALYEDSLRWPVLAGLAIGVAFWMKTDGVIGVVVIAAVLLFTAPGGRRRRLLSAAAVAITAIAMIAAYVGSQYYFTGYLGLQRQSAWNLYGRVATFVDCSGFDPPAGTRFLCPSQPLGHRESQAYYQGAPQAPAPARFGPPWAAPGSANAVVEKFSIAAIEQQPLRYAGAIATSLGNYVFPVATEGDTPRSIREGVSAAAAARQFQPAYALLYAESLGYSGSEGGLATYEKYTLVQGPLLIILLIGAILGPLFLPIRMRAAAVLFTLTAIGSIAFAAAGSGYDARYAYPTFGPLAAGAALGIWGLGVALARAAQRRWRAPLTADTS